MPLDLATVIREAIEDSLLDLSVAMPAKVLSYNAGTQTADVQPLLRRLVRDADDSELLLSEGVPAVYAVPVAWPSGGATFLRPDLTPGDEVLLVCADTDTSVWASSGAESAEPEDHRAHHLSHAIAVPGLRSGARTLDTRGFTLSVGGTDSPLLVAPAFRKLLSLVSRALQSAGPPSTPLTTGMLDGILTAALNAVGTELDSSLAATGDVVVPLPP